MKIRGVRGRLLHIPLKAPFKPVWHSGDTVDKIEVTMVEIATDEGLTGIGCGPGSAKAVLSLIDPVVRDGLIGKDIFKIGEHVSFINNLSLRVTRPWLIEIALWDAMGKFVGRPVCDLLGRCQDKVAAYAATGEMKPLEQQIELVQRFIEEGFETVKLRAHSPDPKEDIRRIRAVRKAVGDEARIAVDVNQAWVFSGPGMIPQWTLKDALWFGSAISDLGIEWLEEPLAYSNLAGYSSLRKTLPIPLAGGEMATAVSYYRDCLHQECLDIYQADPVMSGGIWQAKKIADLVEMECLTYSPHTWTNGFGLAVDLQVAAAVPHCPYIEYPYDPPGWVPEVRDAILTHPITVDQEGYLQTPTLPGIGVELDTAAIEHFTIATV